MASYDENIAMLGIGLDSAPAAQGAQRVINELERVKTAGENLKESFDKIGANLGAKFNITFPNVPDGIGEKLAGIASAMSAMSATDPDALAAGTKALSESLGTLFKVKTPSILLPKYLSSLAQGIMDFNNATGGRDAGVALHIGNLAAAIQALEKVGNIDPAIPNSIKNTLQSLSEVPKSFENVTGFKERITALRDTLSTLSTLNEMANNMPSKESIDKITSAVSNLQLHLAVSTQADGGRNVANLGRGLEALSKSLRVLTKVDVNQVVGKLGAFRSIAAELKDAMQGTPTGDGTMGYFGRSIAQMVDTLALLSEVDLSSVRGEAIKEKVELMRELLSKVSAAPASQDGNLANVGQAVMQIVAALRVLSEVDLKGIDLHLLKGRLNVIKEFMSLAQGVNGNAPVDISSSIIAIAAAFKTLSEIQLGNIDIGMLRRRLEVISDFMASANTMLAQTPQGASNIGREISMLARGLQVLSQIQLPDTARIQAIGNTLETIGHLNFRPMDTTGTVNLGRVATQLSRGLQSLASINASDIDLEQLRATVRGIASMAADFSSANNAIGAFAVTIGKLKFQKDSAHRLTEVAQALASFQRVSPPTATVMRFLEAVGRLADISPKVIRALAGMNAEFNRSSIPIQGTTNDLSMMNREISALRSGMSGLYQTFLTFAHSPVIRFFRSATKDAAEFGRELAYINSITLGEYDTANVSKGILGMSSVLGDSAQIANSFYYAYSSGMRGTEEEMLGFTETMAKLSKVIRADATTTTNAITTIVNSYGLGMGDTQMLADWTTQIIKFGKATGRDLASALGNIVAPAQNAGLTLQELGAGIASLTKVMRTAPAITGYARMIEKLANPTAKVQKEAERYNISLGREAIQSRGFYNVMKQIHDVAQQNPDVINKIFPDIRGKRAAVQLLTKGWEDFSRQMANFAPGGMNGALGEAFGELYKNTSVQVEALAETFKKLRIEIGKAITSILTLGGMLTPLLTRFNNMGETSRGVIGSVAGVATIAAAMQSVGFLVQTLKAMKLRNQAVLNPTMALPQMMAAMAMPGGAAAMQWTNAMRAELLYPSLANELQRSLTKDMSGMRGSVNAAFGSMALTAASAANTMKQSMLGILPGTGLLAKGISGIGMAINRILLAFNGMNSAQFAIAQSGLLTTRLSQLGIAARAAGMSATAAGVSIVSFGLVAAGLGYTIGTLLYKIPAVQRAVDSMWDSILGTAKHTIKTIEHEDGVVEKQYQIEEQFNSNAERTRLRQGQEAPYRLLGKAALDASIALQELIDSLHKTDKQEAMREALSKRMDKEIEASDKLHKEYNAGMQEVKTMIGASRLAQKDVELSYRLLENEKNIRIKDRQGQYATTGNSSNILVALVDSMITNRGLDKIAVNSQKAIEERIRFESAVGQDLAKKAQEESEKVAKTVQAMVASAKSIVGIINDAKKFSDELTTLRGSITDKFTDRMFKNWTTGRQFGYLNERLMRPGGVMERYNAALASGDFKSAGKLGSEIIGVFSKQEGILSNLAKAAQNANNKTVQLIASMDKFSTTAVQGVDYESMEAQKLMSRSFETLPNIPLLTESGFDSNKFLADQQGQLTTQIDSLTQSTNDFVQRQTRWLETTSGYIELLQKALKETAEKLSQINGLSVEENLRRLKGEQDKDKNNIDSIRKASVDIANTLRMTKSAQNNSLNVSIVSRMA